MAELSVAFAITEANSGTGLDNKTTALRQGQNFILNGGKHLITNADFTNLFMVCCCTKPRELGRKGMSALLVDLDTPGFTNEHMPHLMGCKGLGHGWLTFKYFVLPLENVVGEEGQGLEAMGRVTDKAMLVFGGRSYLQSYPIERLGREGRLNVLEEGTPSFQRLVSEQGNSNRSRI